MKNIKKIVSALILLALALSLVSCGGEKSLNCSVSELQTKISAALADDGVIPYDEDRLLDDLGIKTADYSEGFFIIPANSSGVDSVAFFVCADSTAADSIKLRLETFVADTRNQQKDYNADNYRVSLDAEVIKEGKYVYLVMAEKKADIKKIIAENLK